MSKARTELMHAGLLLGVGLGGFAGAIVLQQDRFSDGLLHGAVWLITVWGVALLWRACARNDLKGMGRVLVGASLLGWAGFNIVETRQPALIGMRAQARARCARARESRWHSSCPFLLSMHARLINRIGPRKTLGEVHEKPKGRSRQSGPSAKL